MTALHSTVPEGVESNYVAFWHDRKTDTVIVVERDTVDGSKLFKVVYNAPYYFFVEDPEGSSMSMTGKKVRRVDFKNRDEMEAAVANYKAEGLSVFETDISPEQRVLIDNYYNRTPAKAKVCFFDIELDVDPARIPSMPSIDDCYAPLNAVSIVQEWSGRVVIIAVPPVGWTGSVSTIMERLDELKRRGDVAQGFNPEIKLVDSELNLLAMMVAELRNADIVCGFNSTLFDVPMIVERMRKLGGDAFVQKLEYQWCTKAPRRRTVIKYGQEEAAFSFAGKSFIDYLEVIDKYQKPVLGGGKSLGVVLENEGVQKKLDSGGKNFKQFYETDFELFCLYNGIDSWALAALDKKLKLISILKMMTKMAPVAYSALLGTVGFVDVGMTCQAIYKYGMRVIDKVPADEKHKMVVEGAIVLNPKTGLWEAMSFIDANSLYPNTIITLNASPEKIVGQFLHNGDDYERIIADSEEEVTFIMETGKVVKAPACKFKASLKKRKWAISAYGTVFDQNEVGIIPSVLASWFDDRKAMKAKMEAKADEVKKFKSTVGAELSAEQLALLGGLAR
jgi:DNA polymerase elongation subunit (family B)